MNRFATLTLFATLAALSATGSSAAQFAAGQGPAGGQSDSRECAYQLNYMPRVTRDHVAAIKDKPVYLVPVCEDGRIGNMEDYGWLFAAGNVGTLRPTIRHNGTLMAALVAQGYDEQDVISLRFAGGDSITLYVRQRNMR